MAHNLLFQETQSFRNTWMFFIILGIAVFAWYNAIQQFVYVVEIGSNPVSDLGLVILLIVFGVILPVLFYINKLETRVYEDGIYVRYFPFHLLYRKYSFGDIKNFKLITYSALKDYGGWGIRYKFKDRTKAYNVSGNSGVLLEFKNGNKLLIGSQRPDELCNSIKT
ncbi:conserved hypothetical protein [Methanohalobium evestigatum Z-7303]|uniref:Bacterial Pleckstrin homology domain-containing protein n=2 Tax=root TaxID=1 RepID=D7E6F4_METEZ|nr:DUF6141 family protein [Methanohalobium evestigatum]ADI73176.1 conserved hypothetical protein [Methanohalobium evestigatum Z-7303]AGF93273.1 conserved hypothetical protein, membrane [uncultured organism]